MIKMKTLSRFDIVLLQGILWPPIPSLYTIVEVRWDHLVAINCQMWLLCLYYSLDGTVTDEIFDRKYSMKQNNEPEQKGYLACNYPCLEVVIM